MPHLRGIIVAHAYMIMTMRFRTVKIHTPPNGNEDVHFGVR